MWQPELTVPQARYWIVNQILSKGLHNADQECLTYTTALMDKLEQVRSQYTTAACLKLIPRYSSNHRTRRTMWLSTMWQEKRMWNNLASRLSPEQTTRCGPTRPRGRRRIPSKLRQPSSTCSRYGDPSRPRLLLRLDMPNIMRYA